MTSAGASFTSIQQACAILRRGGLVAFPTETVYGLGADASNPAAVAKIFALKGRPSSHPVIVHIPSVEYLSRWAREIPGAALALARAFWPGPLTLVLLRAPCVPDAVTGGQDTVGLRVPAHPLAQALLRELAAGDDGRRLVGIAAPSANRFGRISPTTAAHVREDLGGGVEIILDGGPCEVGIESTIVDFSRGEPVLLRPGRITPEDIARVIGVSPGFPGHSSPRAPGTLESHYAPRCGLRLVASAGWERELAQTVGTRAVLSFRPQPPGDTSLKWIEAPTAPEAYSQALYASLRALDASGCDWILAEMPPSGPGWAAVLDRLGRACSR